MPIAEYSRTSWLSTGREGVEPENVLNCGAGRTMMWPGTANSGKFEPLHSFLSFDKDFQIEQMLNFTFKTLIFPYVIGAAA